MGKSPKSLQIPSLDLKRQYKAIGKEIDAAVKEVFEEEAFILGPKVEALEEKVAAHCGAKYAVGVASGSDALYLALRVLGVAEGDEVITTPFTFFATAGAIWRTGARPVFVDIDPCNYNIDSSLIEEKITQKTRAILPVHLYGQCADMEPIMEIAHKHRLGVIEDAAQAIGAEYQGKKAGSIGDVGCFSFFPSKNLGGAGDGGMVTTNSAEIAEKVTLLRQHGAHPKYFHSLVGVNSRLDALQAAVLLVKLKYLDDWNQARRKNASYYNERLGAIKGVVVPFVEPKCLHIYHQYVIRAPKRDALFDYLKEKGIGVGIYYPVPLHLQKCFAYLGQGCGDLPQSERAAKEVIALPIFPELTEEEMDVICGEIASFLEKGN